MKKNLLLVITLLTAGLVGQSLEASQKVVGLFGWLNLTTNPLDASNSNYIYNYNLNNGCVSVYLIPDFNQDYIIQPFN